MVLDVFPGPAADMRKPFITAERLELAYRSGKDSHKVLEQIDLAVSQGEFVAVLGPSGCGKSSLLKILAGYEKPTGGRILIEGEPHQGPNIEIGVVFQQANLFPWLNIEKNVEFGLKMKGMPRANRKKEVVRLLETVDLANARHLLPHQLSGGMKQRAAIARSLATEPKIILMDEPFGALDSITRQTLQEQLKNLWKQTNKTIFFITHDVDEAIFLGSRLLVMNGSPGEIVLDEPNPLLGQIVDPEQYRGLAGYHELRQLLVNHLKK